MYARDLKRRAEKTCGLLKIQCVNGRFSCYVIFHKVSRFLKLLSFESDI